LVYFVAKFKFGRYNKSKFNKNGKLKIMIYTILNKDGKDANNPAKVVL